MKTHVNTHTSITVLLILCLLLGFSAQAQEQGFRWGKWSQGSGPVVESDNVIDSYIDSSGNVYIFGRCSTNARLGEGSPYICPMDSALGNGYYRGRNWGVYLAKIDTSGNVLWCKSVRGPDENHLVLPWNMVVRGDRITIAFDARIERDPNNKCWLYFCDTLITTIGGHFYDNEFVTYFVTFDMDGNRIDVHDVRLWAKNNPNYPHFLTIRLCGLVDSRFGIDEDGSIHLFTCTTGAYVSEDSLHRAYLIVDGDTNRKYYVDIKTLNDRSCYPCVYYKMSSDWHLLDYRYVIDTIEGWLPLDNLSMFVLKVRNIVEDGGYFYLNGRFHCEDAYLLRNSISEIDTFSVTVWLDSIHYLQVDNIRDFDNMPFLIKLDKSGNIIWVQQLYTDAPNDDGVNYDDVSFGGLSVDDDYVYSMWSPVNWLDSRHTIPCYYYFDKERTIPIVHEGLGFYLIACYNKTTGEPVKFYFLDSFERPRFGDIAIVGDEIIGHTIPWLSWKTVIYKMNKHTREVTSIFPIDYYRNDWQPRNHNMSVSSNGWIFRGEWAGRPMVDGQYICQIDRCAVMTLYYDSSLDLRPRPCPRVDSLWGDTISQHIANLSWSSRFSHAGYELAYQPEGGDWDNATTLEVSGLSASVVLPDDRCYQFRIRGLCDGHRVATSSWSDPITLCPKVGIEGVEGPQAISLSPNPATGVVRIVGLAEEVLAIEIYDLNSRRLATYAHTSTFDISGLPQGSYIVRIETASGNRYHQKLVKQ